MTFPLATPEGAAIEEVRARIRQARVDAAEAQRALAEKADDPTPEGAEAFKELLKARDEADKAVGILTDEWERLVGAGLNGKQYGLPFGRRDVLARRSSRTRLAPTRRLSRARAVPSWRRPTSRPASSSSRPRRPPASSGRCSASRRSPISA
jgi:hypothetical protein